MTEPQREPGVYEAMQLQAATQRAMRDIYTGRPDPLASIPDEARAAIADYCEAYGAAITGDEDSHIDLWTAVDAAVDAMLDTQAAAHLPTLAAALRGVGDA